MTDHITIGGGANSTAFSKKRCLVALKVASMFLCWAVVLGGCVDKTPVPPPKVTRDIGATDKFVTALTIDDPRPFGPIYAQASYFISNGSECVPMDHSIALGGVRPRPQKTLDLAVVKVDEGVFRAEALKHPFADEDYYGLGVCRWAISLISFDIRQAGRSQSAIIGDDDIMDGRTKHLLCFMDPSSSTENCRNPKAVGSNIRHLFFPVSIESHKAQ